MSFSPATMGIIGLGSQALGMATSAVGSYYGAKTEANTIAANARSQTIALEGQERLSKANARIAEVNARISEMSAESALQQGNHQIAQVTLRAGQLKGRQRASIAANGVDLSVGSAREIQVATDMMRETDKYTAKLNAMQAAFGYRVQAMNQRTQGQMTRAEGAGYGAQAAGIVQGAPGVSPGLAATTSLIGGATQVASSWYSMQQSGMFTQQQQQPQYNTMEELLAGEGIW